MICFFFFVQSKKPFSFLNLINFKHLEFLNFKKMPYLLFYARLDKVSLHSCLLVNRFWCEVSVPILWTSIQNYNTLIACLPNESKEILYENEIIISTPTSKPLFNYVTFIKSLSMFE